MNIQTVAPGNPAASHFAMVPQHLGSQQVFFFDGDFRTWDQVVQRAKLNKAIVATIARQLQLTTG